MEKAHLRTLLEEERKERREGVDLKAKIRRTRWVVLLGQFPSRFIDFRSAFSQFSSFEFCKFKNISKYNSCPFFVKLQNEMSSMFLLFMAAHQSSTRIARTNNKIKFFLCCQGYYFATIKENPSEELKI